MNKRKTGSKWGVYAIFCIFGLLFFIMFFRIGYIQVTGKAEGEDLRALMKQNYERTANLQANRGSILDRNGEAIAEDTISYRIYAVIRPSVSEGSEYTYHVKNSKKKKVSEQLAKVLGGEPAYYFERLNRKTAKGEYLYQVEFGEYGKNISHSQMKQLKAYDIDGLQFVEETKRFYPNGVFASNLIGMTQQKDNSETFQGTLGLEKIYDEQLSGEPGKNKFSQVKSALLPGSEEIIKAPKDGENVYLTIDTTIQSILEAALNDVNKKYKPNTIFAAVMNPKTGEILATSQRPTFNPQTGSTTQMSWVNYLHEKMIEPGSTMKTFTLATAIEKGVWTPNELYQSGQYSVNGAVIRDSNQVGWGTISYLEGIQRSSNVAVANMLKKIGRDELFTSLNQFGFGKITGIDLPNEVSGKLLNTYYINAVTTAFGQGSTVTPIQLLQAATAIANNGKMMQPYVVDKIIDPNTGKVVQQTKPKEKGQPISESTAKQVRTILASTVTSEKGTAQKFKNEDYSVAGKTGTAQIAKSTGGYYWGKNQFLYSFLGMAPTDDPQLVMYIAVEKPKLSASQYGSDPTSEIFNKVMGSSLKYMHIESDTNVPSQQIEIGDYVEKSTDEVQSDLMNKNLQPVRIGEVGMVQAQVPEANTKTLINSKVFLKTAGDVVLPDFTGWSMRDVLTYQKLSDVQFDFVGDGYVTKQSLKASTVYQKGKIVKLTFKEKAKK